MIEEEFRIGIGYVEAGISGISWKKLYKLIADKFGIDRRTAELIVDAYIDSFYEGELTAEQSKLLERYPEIVHFLEEHTKDERD
jgi:hypothetical protein